MFEKDEKDKVWRNGVFLCTTDNSFNADLLESKLRSENIPCIKKYKGASNFIEIFMGSNSAYNIDIYVPKECLEDARNIIVAVPILSDDPENSEPIDFDNMTEEEIDELIGIGEDDNKEK